MKIFITLYYSSLHGDTDMNSQRPAAVQHDVLRLIHNTDRQAFRIAHRY
ncbi:hypothetical protein KCP76_16865 [Salmonella enterica subsp. enterica serovar Weltevreden]|nr:hypothetical protein KCP76_16865 [Salmonella enterica subsp. enterica serovar Weltevreden]